MELPLLSTPAAYPLIVTYEPPSKEATIPPTIPSKKPAIGGANSASRAIPMQRGKAIRKMIKPDKISDFQFFFLIRQDRRAVYSCYPYILLLSFLNFLTLRSFSAN